MRCLSRLSRWLITLTLACGVTALTGCATAQGDHSAIDGGPADAAPTEDATIADASPPDAAPLACEGGDINVTDPGTGHCYMLFQSAANWNTAKSSCEALGDAHLVTVFDLGENAFIGNLTGARFWIGASDILTEGSFVWVTEETVAATYQNWGGNEPNNSGNEDCAEMRTDNAWNDRECNASMAYMCERP